MLTSEDIVNLLYKQKAILQIANPLILFLFRHYLLQEKSWPRSRRALFESYMRTNYDKYEQMAGVGKALGFDRAAAIWGKIAFSISLANQGGKINTSEIADPDAAAAVLEGTLSGVLEKDDPGSEVVGFAHHRYQEYFAAAYLASPYNRDVQIDWLSVLDEPRWQETILNLASAGPVPAIAALRGSIEDILKNPPNGHLAQQLAADRVELASRIVAEVGRTPGSAGETLYEYTSAAVEKLLGVGNPSTQVKMLSACKNLDSIDYYRVAKDALTSRVRWVRNQALIVAAEFDSSKSGISTEFLSQMAYDVVLSRFIRRIPAYLSAFATSRSALLRKHIIFGFFSLLFSVLASAVILAGTYQLSRYIYMQATPSDGETEAVGSSPSRAGPSETESPLDPSRDASQDNSGGVVKGSDDTKAFNFSNLDPDDGSGDDGKQASAHDFLKRFGGAPLAAVLLLTVIGCVYYFSIQREIEIELVILTSGVAVLALSFAVDQLVEGKIVSLVPILEVLCYVVVPLTILFAGMVRISSVCVYGVGVELGAARGEKLSTLIGHTFEQTTSGSALRGSWKFIKLFWRDLSCAASTTALVVFVIYKREFIWFVLATIIILAILIIWATIRSAVVRAAFAWMQSLGTTKVLGVVGGIVVGPPALFTVIKWLGDHSIDLQSSHPDAARYVGIGMSAIMLGTVAWCAVSMLLWSQVRYFYLSRLVNVSDVRTWMVAIKAVNPYLQAALLDNIDHKNFRLTTAQYYDAIVQLQSAIADEPALSRYWQLRHKIEAIQRQRRGEE